MKPVTCLANAPALAAVVDLAAALLQALSATRSVVVDHGVCKRCILTRHSVVAVATLRATAWRVATMAATAVALVVATVVASEATLATANRAVRPATPAVATVCASEIYLFPITSC